jgi:hypothetical protein
MPKWRQYHLVLPGQQLLYNSAVLDGVNHGVGAAAAFPRLLQEKDSVSIVVDPFDSWQPENDRA